MGKSRRRRGRQSSIAAEQGKSGGEASGKQRWRTLIITTAVVAIVSTVVTLAINNFGTVWHKIRPKPPVNTEVERRQVPLDASSSAVDPSRPAEDSATVGTIESWGGRVWALPASVDSTATPWVGKVPDDNNNFGPAFGTWVTRAEGADVGTTELRIVVTAQDKDVVISGVCAHLTGPRIAPMDGTLFYMEPQGDEPEPASINLDSGNTCAPEFGAAPVHVEAGKNKVIDVSASTRGHTVSWYPELRLVVDGKRQTTPVGGNQTFRTTALLDDLTAYRHYFSYVYEGSPPRFREGLADPSQLAYLRKLAYGGNG
ncbi:hypothetical protein PSN13_03808 [Micromonospora saelicesensis]|uniref:Uncharacterized protein n=1 Tax=Micromonospora saelicesensis TaxID=285676 RepID=A0A328NS98_9ACTN|nr:hypothetical protein [Micromonospora saelicesensis]RAO32475.1 hypothetical protein PSN13_03808 [Micromonospora saelicesensis]